MASDDVGFIPAQESTDSSVTAASTPSSMNPSRVSLINQQKAINQAKENEIGFKPAPQQQSEDVGFIPADNSVGFQQDNSQFDTPGQQAMTMAEGAARGVAGPLATGAELALSKMGLPGMSAEEQKGREEASPWLSKGSEAAAMAASMYTGVGEAGLLAKSLKSIKAAEDASKYMKIGTVMLKSGLEMSALQGGDELSDAMLGKNKSASAISANIAEAGALGLFSGGVFGTIDAGIGKGAQSLESLDNAKLSNKVKSALAGAGAKASELHGSALPEDVQAMLDHPDFDTAAGKIGQKAAEAMIKTPRVAMEGLAAHKIESMTGSMGVAGNMASTAMGTYGLDHFLGPMLTKIIDKPISKVVKNVTLGLISDGNTDNLATAISYANKVARGARNTNKAIESIFKGGSLELKHDVSDEDINKVKKYIENGGINQDLQNQMIDQKQQGAQYGGEGVNQYADGGAVTPAQPTAPTPLAKMFPQQNMQLSQAKSRAANYLSILRPTMGTDQSKLPYDIEYPDHAGNKAYNDAIKIAIKPLSILKHVKDGTLDQSHLKHLGQMYPEMYYHLSNELTKKITENQLSGEKPPYKVRQAMSLFLGAPLETNMTPASIQAAQMVFMANKANSQQQAPMSKPKKKTQSLDKDSQDHLTADQAAEKRRSSLK